MIDPISFILLIVLSICITQVCAPDHAYCRLIVSTLCGACLLAIIHINALLLASLTCLSSILIFSICRIRPKQYTNARLPYILLCPLFIPDMVDLVSESPILWLGSAFFIIRQMMTVSQAVKRNVTVNNAISAIVLATFFMPALPSGPIFNGVRCWEKLKQGKPPVYGKGSYRLLEGFIYIFAISGFLSAGLDWLDTRLPAPEASASAGLLVQTALNTLVFVPLMSFGFLFASFYGYSRVAEGSALLYGFEVPENFNKPHLARDLADFWHRWHRSMADFVKQYVYLPLLVSGINTRLALVCTFVFMGLWHDLSLSFVIWGLGHGLGLAFLVPWLRSHANSALLIRVFSLLYVVFLSTIAHTIYG